MNYDNYWIGKEKGITQYYDDLYLEIKEDMDFKGKICDLGGGSGSFLNYFNIKDATIVDISKSGLDIAKERGYNILNSELYNLPFKDKEFDNVLLFEILEHIKEPEKALDEALRIGKIVWIGQPNTIADGDHHLYRIYPSKVMKWAKDRNLEMEKCFYSPSGKGTIYKYLPFKKFFSQTFPDRFARMIVVKVRK